MKGIKMKYRLGLDMGATSIGWAVYDIDNMNLIDTGVRIFDDGRDDKTKASLCVKRRMARGARKLQTRKHIQKQFLLKTLVELGLFPQSRMEQQNLKSLNPYLLRVLALDKKIDCYELGRIFFHLVQRKGFLSNRKDNKEEGGKLKEGYRLLQEKIKTLNARTYGEYLYLCHQENPNQPIRLKNTFDASGKFIGAEFPFRELYKEEFYKIFDKQREFYPQLLTPEVREKIENILFFQRPLKEAEEGFCPFEPKERRIAKAHPLFQEHRMWQHILNLTFAPETSSEYEGLTKQQIEKLIHILKNPTEYVKTKQPILTYSSIKNLLGLDKKGLFNFERKSGSVDTNTKGIYVDTTEHAIGMVPIVYEEWKQLTVSQKETIIKVLSRPTEYIDFPKTLSIEQQDKLIIQYLCSTFSFSTSAATALLYDVDLEDGYGSLSEKALNKIVSAMKLGMPYDVACKEVGYHHSFKNHTSLNTLPYYGEILAQSCIGQKNNPQTPEEKYGKINNATVHVALNQIRHLVNELIHRYGKPFDISIEYARDLNASTEERKKLSDTRDKNELENQRILQELNEKIENRAWTKRDIEKYKIWKTLGTPKGENPLNCRECPFTGEKISVADLMNGDRFQIEHLIPFSRSLDNSIHNKVIASAWANKIKANRTPFEAFHDDTYAPKITWTDIQRRVKKLSLEQQWRFSKNAMAKFEEKEGPIARSLNDTRYMTRLLQDYLLPIVREDGKKTVQAVVGQLTAMIRKSWGLNQYKNKEEAEEYRSYHNHHAIDAIIVATIDRGQINNTAHQLKNVRYSAIEEFKDEFYKFKDSSVSKEEKENLRTRIKDFVKEREAAIIKQYIPMPSTLSISEILNQVQNISISHKPKLKNVSDRNATVGQLHEDTAYGLKSFIDENSLTARFKTGNGANKKIIEKDITEYIPIFYTKEDKQAYYDAYKNWFIIERKAKYLNAKTSAEKAIKKALMIQEATAVQNLRIAATKAFKWFVGGGNFCAEIYQINPTNKINGVPTKDAGEWKSEIISNYNATIRTSRNENIFYWKNRYPNAKRIMCLKRNDMVLGFFTKEQAYQEDFPKGIQNYVRQIFTQNPLLERTEVLFRVKNIGGNGQFALLPHNIAKEEKNTKSWVATAGSLQKYQAKQVFISPTGRISHAQ